MNDAMNACQNAQNQTSWTDYSALVVTTDFIDTVPGLGDKYKQYLDNRLVEEQDLTKDIDDE